MTDQAFRAEFGEDRLLAERFAARSDGFYAEIGAYDGLDGSATWFFEQLGWDGVLVEADPELAERCRAARPRAHTVHCAVVAPGAPSEVQFEVLEGCRALSSLGVGADELRGVEHIADELELRRVAVPARTIDDVLAENGAPRLDFITIDVNGYEWEALQGLSLERWRPEVVILERATHLPDRRILGHMHRHGYRFRRRTGVNDWFVRCSYPSELGARYRAWLAVRHWAPAYLTLYMPLLHGPGKRALKRALTRMGLLDRTRTLRRRGP